MYETGTRGWGLVNDQQQPSNLHQSFRRSGGREDKPGQRSAGGVAPWASLQQTKKASRLLTSLAKKAPGRLCLSLWDKVTSLEGKPCAVRAAFSVHRQAVSRPLAGKQPLPSHLCRAFKEAEMVARLARAAWWVTWPQAPCILAGGRVWVPLQIPSHTTTQAEQPDLKHCWQSNLLEQGYTIPKANSKMFWGGFSE